MSETICKAQGEATGETYLAATGKVQGAEATVGQVRMLGCSSKSECGVEVCRKQQSGFFRDQIAEIINLQGFALIPASVDRALQPVVIEGKR